MLDPYHPSPPPRPLTPFQILYQSSHPLRALSGPYLGLKTFPCLKSQLSVLDLPSSLTCMSWPIWAPSMEVLHALRQTWNTSNTSYLPFYVCECDPWMTLFNFVVFIASWIEAEPRRSISETDFPKPTVRGQQFQANSWLPTLRGQNSKANCPRPTFRGQQSETNISGPTVRGQHLRPTVRDQLPETNSPRPLWWSMARITVDP